MFLLLFLSYNVLQEKYLNRFLFSGNVQYDVGFMRGSAGDYQADEQAGVARLSCQFSSR